MPKRIHWSDIRMFDRFNGSVVYKSPEALHRYLAELREHGYTENDGYYLAIERDGRWVSVEGEDFDQNDIDWTEFED